MIKKSILLIEDNRDIRNGLMLRLANSGYFVFPAENGEMGLETARQKDLDLIILDLMLPGMCGEALCKTIREDSDKRFATIPIIMLTAKNSDVDQVIGRVIGADIYLTKPYDVNRLLSEVARLTA